MNGLLCSEAFIRRMRDRLPETGRVPGQETVITVLTAHTGISVL